MISRKNKLKYNKKYRNGIAMATIFLLTFLIIPSLVNARDEKVKVDYCEFAFSKWDVPREKWDFMDESRPERTDGKFGKALEFDGDEVLGFGTITLEKEGSTFSWWMKPERDGGIFNYNRPDGSYYNHLELRNNGKKLFGETNTNCNHFEFDEIPDARDEFKHYAIVFQNSRAYLYINGEEWGEAKDYSRKECGGSGVDRLVDDVKLNYLGPQTYQSKFKGIMDDVRVYGRALDAGEIQNIYDNSNVPTDDLTLEYKFESDDGEIEDTSGNNYNTKLYWKKSDIFKEWDEDKQEGVFLNVENENKEVGEDSNYERDWKTEEKDWYNEKYSGKTTHLPIIDVDNETDKYLYFKCNYIVGDNRILIHSAGSSHIGHITNAFNLTEGVIPENKIENKIRSRYPGARKIYYGRLRADYSSSGVFSTGKKELYPNSNPYGIYKVPSERERINLADRPTGIYYNSLSYILREEGHTNLVSNPFSGYLFFLNNTNSEVSLFDYLIPKRTEISKENLDTGETGEFEISDGDRVRLNATFKNPYEREIKADVYLSLTHGHHQYGSKDIGRCQGTSNVFEREFNPGEEKQFSITHTVPIEGSGGDEKCMMPRLLGSIHTRPSKPGGAWNYRSWTSAGVTDYPYFHFKKMDPRIEYEEDPVFSIEVGMERYPNIDRRGTIKPQDAEIRAVVYGDSFDSDNIVDTETFEISEEFTKTTEKFTMPIKDEYIDDEYDRYYIKLYGIATGPHAEEKGWEGERIVSTSTSPYFEAGTIQHAEDRTFSFRENRRNDEKIVRVFNPTFKEGDMELEVIDITNDNFSVKIEGESSKELTLEPLESREFTIEAEANYEEWPDDFEWEDGTFKINSTLTGDDIDKNMVMEYELDHVSIECRVVHEGNEVVEFFKAPKTSKTYYDNNKYEMFVNTSLQNCCNYIENLNDPENYKEDLC